MSRTRRELIAGATALAGLALVPDVWAKRLLSTTARIGPGTFADGVASGEPTANAVTFWGRLTTDRPKSGARLIVARDAGLSDVVATTVVPTGEAMDHCLKARIGGLDPASLYWYAWESGDETSPIGRTRTANAPDSTDRIHVATSSCQNFDDGFFTGHTHAAALDPWDLVVFLGDYTYETTGGLTGNKPRIDPLHSNDLASYREKIRIYRTDAGLRELHRLHPCAHIWDDHEVADNYTDNNPAPSRQQRIAGYRASFEWLPRMAFPNDRLKIFKSLRLGARAEVFLLDERQYRTGPGTPNSDAPNPFLGRTQMDWLKAGLKASTATWKLIANQHPVFPLGSGAAQPDEWPGFRAERTELLGFIESEGLDNVVFATGDIHCFFASELNKDFPALGLGTVPSVAVDYVTGSITSNGLVAPESVVRASSPWIKQFDGGRRGYGAFDLGGTQLVTEYRVGPVTTPAAAVTTSERFTQPVGQASFTRETNPPAAAPLARAAKAAAHRAGAAEARLETAAARRRGVAKAQRRAT